MSIIEQPVRTNADSGVTNVGATTINGNVGSSPTNAITGLPPGAVTGGAITSLATAELALSDAAAAYDFLTAQTPTLTLTGIDLGGLTLRPGVYRFGSSAQLTGLLTLDAQSNTNAVFIFEIGSTLTTATSAIVSVINGGPSNGVYWQVGSSATLGVGTLFAGNILAHTSITLDPFAELSCGRAFAGIVATGGTVTLANTNRIAINAGPTCAGGYGGGYEAVAGGGFQRISDRGTAAVPGPASLALLFIGLIGLAVVFPRRAAQLHQPPMLQTAPDAA